MMHRGDIPGHLVGTVVLFALAVLSATPAEGQETCAYCRQIGSTTFACDAESGAVECSGTFYGQWCWDCSEDPQASASAADGAALIQELIALGYEWAAALDRPGAAVILDPVADRMPETWAAESVPILVMRSPCTKNVEAWAFRPTGVDRPTPLDVRAGFGP